MRKLSLLLIVVLVSGCAFSNMTSEKTLTDGSVIKYKVAITSIGQDFTGTDIKASLDPEGKTTVKAGAVDNVGSQANIDAAMAVVETLKILLPYVVATPVPPPVTP